MSPLLLVTKFHRPAPPVKTVQRQRLVQRLNDGLAAGRLLTLVSAPAGFGKTTCASAWISGVDLPVAWLSLDPADDELGRFFTYLIAALQQVDPALGQEIAGVLRSGQTPPGEVIADALINDLLARSEPLLLVLDDLHVIQDRRILDGLERLLTGLAQASTLALHLILLTREDPPLPLARLRANNRMTEIRAADLRFSGAEADHFLNVAMGLDLSPSDIVALEERTEGWIVGLQLAALALQARGEAPQLAAASPRPSFIAALRGSHRSILSYLAEEVLSRQPEAIQRFLLDSSILDSLNGALCDAVCSGEIAACGGSQALLEQLYRANLFLVPLDDDAPGGANWYRYHHLFASVLRERLEMEGRGRVVDLHRRASRWYAAQPAFTNEAIQHALAAEDYPFAVELIERWAMDFLMQWQTKTVAGWMEALPQEWAAQSPKTNLAFAWLHLMGGNPAQAGPYLERLRPLFDGADKAAAFEEPAVRMELPLLAEWLALQSMLSNAQGKPAEGLALAQQALAILERQNGQPRLGSQPPQPGAFDRAGYVLTMIYTNLATAYQQLENYTQAMEAYQQIIRQAQATGDLFSELMGVSALGLLALNHGQLHFAHALAAQGEERVKRFGGTPPISQAVYGELGEVYFQWNDIARAREYFERSVHASALSGFPDAGIYNAVFRSRLCLMEGDLDAAADEIEAAAAQMRAISPTAVREEVISQQICIALAQGRLAAAEAALAGPLPELPEGGPLAFVQAQMVVCALRILLHRAQVRGDAASLDEALALAGRLLAAVLQRQYVPLAITTLLLRGQMQALGMGSECHACAQADFLQALALGQPEGYISIFVEEGAPVAAALKELIMGGASGSVQPEYIEAVLAAFPTLPAPGIYASHAQTEQATPIPLNDLVEPLTERELEVLRLIADGLKYEEVAERLFISLNTVRTYVKEIYSKLNVNNRTKAIAAAVKYHLI